MVLDAISNSIKQAYSNDFYICIVPQEMDVSGIQLTH